MRCPFCNADKDQLKVIDSRSCDGGTAIRRRRECTHCAKRFTTYEKIERPVRLMVVKKDGKREQFERNKVLSGLFRAAEKRPISTAQLEKIVDEVERNVQDSLDRELSTTDVGKLIMRRLKALDKVAYVRFASVYLEFADVSEFISELKTLVGARTAATDKKKKKK
jgi:transcriptional repressor NrdR